MKLAAGAVAQVLTDADQRVRTCGVDPNLLNLLSPVNVLNLLSSVNILHRSLFRSCSGRNRFGGSIAGAGPPRRLDADAVDAQFAEEVEMRPEIVHYRF